MGKISDTSPPDIYFGVPTRPSTPIFDLLGESLLIPIVFLELTFNSIFYKFSFLLIRVSEHKYQSIWTEQQLQREDRCKEASTVKHRIGKNKNGEIIVFETKVEESQSNLNFHVFRLLK